MGAPLPGRFARGRAAFYLSRLFGQAGQTVFLVALFLVAGAGDAALGVSAAFVSMMAASVLFGLPGGALADWMGARRAFVLGAVLRGAAIASALLVVGRPEWMWAAVFVYSAVSQVYSPSEMALVSVTHPRRAGPAHTTLVVLQYGGQGVGLFALAPLFHYLGGIPGMLVGAALVQAVAILATAVCAVSFRGVAMTVHTRARDVFDLSTTFRFLVRDPRAAYAVVLLSFCQLAMKSLIVSLPPYVREDLELGLVQLGVIAGIAALGGLAGFYWTSRTLTAHLAPKAMRVTLLLAVAALVALAALDGRVVVTPELGVAFFEPLNLLRASSYALPFSIAAILALSLTVAPIGARTVLSETAPAHHQSRVFATQSIVSDVIVIAPLLVSGFGTEVAGARVTLVALALLGLAMFFALERLPRGRISDAAAA